MQNAVCGLRLPVISERLVLLFSCNVSEALVCACLIESKGSQLGIPAGSVRQHYKLTPTGQQQPRQQTNFVFLKLSFVLVPNSNFRPRIGNGLPTQPLLTRFCVLNFLGCMGLVL